MGMRDVARGRDARGRWREVLLSRSDGELDGSMGESISLGSEVAHVSLLSMVQIDPCRATQGYSTYLAHHA